MLVYQSVGLWCDCFFWVCFFCFKMSLKVSFKLSALECFHQIDSKKYPLWFKDNNKNISPLQTRYTSLYIIYHQNHHPPPKSQTSPNHHPKPVPLASTPPTLNGGCKGFKASHSVRLKRPEALRRRRMSSKSAVLLASCACCNDAAQAAASWRLKMRPFKGMTWKPGFGGAKSWNFSRSFWRMDGKYMEHIWMGNLSKGVVFNEFQLHKNWRFLIWQGLRFSLWAMSGLNTQCEVVLL